MPIIKNVWHDSANIYAQSHQQILEVSKNEQIQPMKVLKLPVTLLVPTM